MFNVHFLTLSQSIRRNRRRWSALLLLTVSMQAMFAQGFMPGKGSWVELCLGDTGSVSLVYLDSNELGDSPASGHSAETVDHCVFSSGAVAASCEQVLASLQPDHLQVSALFLPFAERQFWPARLSRAPPVA